MNLTKKSFIFICLTFLLFYPQVFFAQESVSPSGINKSSNTPQANESGKPATQQVGEQLKAGQNGQAGLEGREVKQVQGKRKPAKMPLEQKKKKAHKRLSQPEKKRGKAEVDVKPEKRQVIQTDTSIERGKEISPVQGIAPDVERGDLAKDHVPVTSNEEFYKKNAVKLAPLLQIFGHNIFTGPKTSFTPIEAVPVSKDYLIGPGDEIKVVLWGRMDASYTLEVDNNGEIVFPKLGPLSVAGLSFAQVEELIKLKLGAMTGVNVNVTMGKLRSILVFALGEVKSPGIYMVSALATVANALHASGGLSPLGSLRKIELRRQKKVVAVCDLYDFLLKGDISSDARLMSADVIFVPQTGPMVSVSGNVKRPAIYELKDDMSIENALKLAGGLQPDAYNQRIQIMRPSEHRVKLILDASYEDVYKLKEITLQDGDLIRISSILPSPVNAVYLYGNIVRPGEYEYKPGYGVLDILSGLGSLATDSYFDYAVVKRYRFEDMETELIPFDLGKLLSQKDETQNIPLEPLDEIYVFNKWLFEDRACASVSGQVRKPGRYYIEEMRIKDLIFKAGDFTEDAYLPKAELIRTDKDRRKRTIYLDLAGAMVGNPKHNIKVQNEDSLVIHSIWEKKWKEFVHIKGEIKKPGRYGLTKGMRLSDLIFKSGNFTRGAYKKLGHLYRTDWRTKDVTIHIFNVAMAMKGDRENNLLLKDLDQVVIHNIRQYVPVEKIKISGEVQKPGIYPYAENMKIKDLIVVAQNVTRNAYMDLGHLYRTDWRTKEVTIYTFDIKKALEEDANLVEGESQNNLLLQEGDQVVIHSIWEYKPKYTVSIKGMVHKPGEYPFAENMTIRDLIVVSGNIRDGAHLEKGELVRYRIVEGEKVVASLINFDVSLALRKDPTNDFSLQPMDVVQIKQIPGWVEKKKAMTIAGEVSFPGTYQILSHEHLSDILKRAGGVTEESYLRGAFFTRESVREKQAEELNGLIKRLEIDMASLATLENQVFLSEEAIRNRGYLMAAQNSLLTKLKEKKPTGRVIISLLPVEKLAGGSNDLLLEAGDRLFIPKNPNTVHVLGAVYHPVTAVYDRKQGSVSYYLDKAGGPTENAQTDQIYIVRIDGSVVSKSGRPDSFEKTVLYPGDSIIVPHQGIRPAYLYTLTETARTPK